ncbi:C1 family peptidase [Rudaeicoccus suwonensis]|uniref:Papain like protease n=1 Tax=Rudaeicoccus suwonensis TaxID=657409 RepID=A0A561E7G1_9MICO|nr:C1 family peptidase [Rudaeicoccus suwonensis]TWE11539.1 papain like protease [Rudaeicoccus suwonensis]
MRKTPLLGAIAAVGALTLTAPQAMAAPNAATPSHRTTGVIQHVRHGMGLNIALAESMKHRNTSSGRALAVHALDSSSVPSSYSLESYALTPGNQGQVGSCVTWATGYSGYGILMNEEGISGAPMAPMYIYSQIVSDDDNGQDDGTTASIALPMEQQQGIDTQSDYTQGTTDYTDLPTQSEITNAANYELSGFQDLTTSGDLQTNIESAISQGEPVVIGFNARSSFENLNSSDYNYDPSPSEAVIGGHEVTIVGYDQTGVTIENSWGTDWGDNGFFTAPWSFITGSDISEVHAMGALVQN